MSLDSRIPPTDSHLWSLADQALVSGSNFLIGVVLARALGVEAFGVYVVAQMYLLYSNTFQASLVVAPMMTLVPAQHDPSERQHMIRGFMGSALLVLLVTLVGVQALAWLLGHATPHLGIAGLALPLGFAMATFQLQDWVRRALYVDTRNRQVFFSDVIAYGGQLTVLVWLSWQRMLDARAALWVLAAAFALSALLTIPAVRLRPDLSMTRRIIRQYARASGDYFASWQLQWLGSQGVILLGTGMVGPQAAGAIRAAQNLLGPVNVVFQWMDNVIPVRSALFLRDAGRGAVVAYLGRIAWLGVSALALFTLVLALFDAPLIVFLYGEEYRPFAILVVLQALYYLFGLGYRLVSYFYRTLNNTRTLAAAGFWWSLTSIIFALISVHWLADRGIMAALVVGEVAGLVYLLWRRSANAAEAAGAGRAPFLLLRRADGSPHLILPLRTSRIMRSALKMYYPSRWTGKLYRWLLRRTLPWRVRLNWIERVPDLQAWAPGLGTALAAVPGASVENTGICVSASSPHGKAMLKLMDAHGAALAYVHMAHAPGAMARLRNECAVLQWLASGPVAPHIPRLLASGDLAPLQPGHQHSATLGQAGAGAAGFYLVESAGPDDPSTHRLSHEHFAFLANLVGNRRVAWCAVVDGLAHEAQALRQDQVLAPVVSAALQALRAAPIPALPVCVEHGDFTPWNIRSNDASGLFVLDWKHARISGLPWLDALHFRCQIELLVRRRQPGQIVPSLQAVFANPAAARYAARFELDSDHLQIFIIVYILRRMLGLAVDGGLSLSRKQQLNHSILSLTLNSVRSPG